MSKIGSNIRKIRSVKGLSQVAYAELFKISRANIGAYEEGRAEPKIDIAIEMANFFSIPLNDLFTKDLTVNQLTNFKPRLEVEINKASDNDQTSLHYVNSELLQDNKMLLQKLKSKKSLSQVFFPETKIKSGIWIETKNGNIKGLSNSNNKAIICSVNSKPKYGDTLLIISETEILLGHYKSGTSKIKLNLIESGIETICETPKMTLLVHLLISSPIANAQNMEDRIQSLEKRVRNLEG